ncbi:hypothetical protein BLA60_09980 [Actinophytocola xinjiangensis]|uniref:DUF4231 domain-containing protein n=1 Tax=Actinophytocola xinjiangensis TaxID=485602 RepID=A0A7Z0WPD4_9PSEU|nr:DUF4231 domain-containing protein [Actinophytocola xinjiangensis]OLF12300.1 hypothetical protein BLA60_09980 [Actinophytocola xinjiangensis]
MGFRSPVRVELPDHGAADFVAAAEAYALRLRQVYDLRATWHRRLYRLSGILVIIAGAGLPLLVSVDYQAKDIVIAITGVLVAAITSLRAFYRWDQSWILLRKTEMAITSALWAWRCREPGTDHEAVVELMKRVHEIREFEAESFFKDLAFPVQRGEATPQR